MDTPFVLADDDDINNIGDAFIEGARVELQLAEIDETLYRLGGATQEELAVRNQNEAEYEIALAARRVRASVVFDTAVRWRVEYRRQINEQRRVEQDRAAQERRRAQRRAEIDNAITSYEREVNDDHVCSICLSSFTSGECQHPSIIDHPACDCRRGNQLYGRECISTWFKEQNTCPTCRNRIIFDGQAARQPSLEPPSSRSPTPDADPSRLPITQLVPSEHPNFSLRTGIPRRPSSTILRNPIPNSSPHFIVEETLDRRGARVLQVRPRNNQLRYLIRETRDETGVPVLTIRPNISGDPLDDGPRFTTQFDPWNVRTDRERDYATQRPSSPAPMVRSRFVSERERFVQQHAADRASLNNQHNEGYSQGRELEILQQRETQLRRYADILAERRDILFFRLGRPARPGLLLAHVRLDRSINHFDAELFQSLARSDRLREQVEPASGGYRPPRTGVASSAGRGHARMESRTELAFRPPTPVLRPAPLMRPSEIPVLRPPTGEIPGLAIRQQQEALVRRRPSAPLMGSSERLIVRLPTGETPLLRPPLLSELLYSHSNIYHRSSDIEEPPNRLERRLGPVTPPSRILMPLQSVPVLPDILENHSDDYSEQATIEESLYGRRLAPVHLSSPVTPPARILPPVQSVTGVAESPEVFHNEPESPPDSELHRQLLDLDDSLFLPSTDHNSGAVTRQTPSTPPATVNGDVDHYSTYSPRIPPPQRPGTPILYRFPGGRSTSGPRRSPSPTPPVPSLPVGIPRRGNALNLLPIRPIPPFRDATVDDEDNDEEDD